jgi:large subunit ribosomal protein L29
MAGRKKKERADELRKLSDEDLSKELEETYRRLFTLRLQLTTRQQTNTSEKAKVTRTIARIRTLQREREIAGAVAAPPAGGRR